MNEEKKFQLHSITVEVENGVVATLDIGNWAIVSPTDIDPSIAENLWLRLGVFIAGGDMALKEFWGN